MQMNFKTVALPIALVPLLLSSVVVAAPRASAKSRIKADVQCLIVGSRFAASKNDRMKLAGTLITFYFLGRIDGEAPKVNLLHLLKVETKHLKASELTAAIGRCGKELALRGRQVSKIGRALVAAG